MGLDSDMEDCKEAGEKGGHLCGRLGSHDKAMSASSRGYEDASEDDDMEVGSESSDDAVGVMGDDEDEEENAGEGED